MREIQRPVHSGYETLRLRRVASNREACFNRMAFPANEQLTARGLEIIHRPTGLFVQGYSR